MTILTVWTRNNRMLLFSGSSSSGGSSYASSMFFSAYLITRFLCSSNLACQLALLSPLHMQLYKCDRGDQSVIGLNDWLSVGVDHPEMQRELLTKQELVFSETRSTCVQCYSVSRNLCGTFRKDCLLHSTISKDFIQIQQSWTHKNMWSIHWTLLLMRRIPSPFHLSIRPYCCHSWLSWIHFQRVCVQNEALNETTGFVSTLKLSTKSIQVLYKPADF